MESGWQVANSGMVNRKFKHDLIPTFNFLQRLVKENASPVKLLMAISEQVVSTLSNLQLSQNTFVSFLVGNVLGFCRYEASHCKCLL